MHRNSDPSPIERTAEKRVATTAELLVELSAGGRHKGPDIADSYTGICSALVFIAAKSSRDSLAAALEHPLVSVLRPNPDLAWGRREC